ncbi:ADP-ribose pyrophosphatase, mitochondrial isoform X5 [Hydra vulgaris]|uniref:ADP-ribose pyrophosphatase, mitochondrial isoform X5 n=1 Tax=Hydra vulgaris TaxID=6087 RepID=A0ABM4CPR4_HYDVU
MSGAGQKRDAVLTEFDEIPAKFGKNVLTANFNDDVLPVKAHFKCRGAYPLNDQLKRFSVSDDLVDWNKKFDSYAPVCYTAESVKKMPVWADPDLDDPAFKEIKFNELDGKVNRISHMGKYEIMSNGAPRNPMGRTGISGRGLLGRWGPNHAADPIVTRWKRDSNGKIERHKDNNKPILEFVSIQRSDTHEWAIPGGMVDAGENISLTLKREFGEEALNSIELDQKEAVKKLIDDLFHRGENIYNGYVDDPRNTDNAWMETVAVNFHDENGTCVGKIPLTAGDDAKAVKWLAIDRKLDLYASHIDFIRKTCEIRGAYFIQ